MSDAVMISLISGSVTVLTTILSLIKIEKVKLQMDDNTKITNEVKQSVNEVKIQTDGMNEKLVSTAGLLGEALGKEKGRDEKRLEQEPILAAAVLLAEEKGRLAAKIETQSTMPLVSQQPVKVEVVNEPIKVVQQKQDDKPQ